MYDTGNDDLCKVSERVKEKSMQIRNGQSRFLRGNHHHNHHSKTDKRKLF
ncbi:hypothetical protein LguiA_015843 [Lonicera macranthoides]